MHLTIRNYIRITLLYLVIFCLGVWGKKPLLKIK